MAKPNPLLIDTLRKTAKRLQGAADYQWGHMGSCNCGHLAQELTNISKADIHRLAMHSEGNWTEQSRVYCPNSGLPMDQLISKMLAAGLSIQDLEHLEKLSDRQVLQKIGVPKLRFNHKLHVIDYLLAWSDLLEEQLVTQIKLPQDLPELSSVSYSYRS